MNASLKIERAFRGYAYDLDGGSKPFKMNSHSRRVCVIISANKEFVIMKGVAKTTLMVHLSRLEDPRTAHGTGLTSHVSGFMSSICSLQTCDNLFEAGSFDLPN